MQQAGFRLLFLLKINAVNLKYEHNRDSVTKPDSEKPEG